MNDDRPDAFDEWRDEVHDIGTAAERKVKPDKVKPDKEKAIKTLYDFLYDNGILKRKKPTGD